MLSKNIIIGVAGPSASGKSLLSSTIANELGSKKAIIISEDSYYKDLGDLPLSAKAERNFDHPNAFDHELLIEHLIALKAGKSIQVPVYDYSTHSRTNDKINIQGDNAIIIVEGILLLSEAAIRDLLSIKIFVDTPLDICFIRRLERDVIKRQRTMDSVVKQYIKTVRPMYMQFIEPSKMHADIIVPRGGKNTIAIELIIAKMNKLLESFHQ